MPIILLSSQNIEFTKDSLRSQTSDCKSSHLSEALAAAFGFRTNATLVANLREPPYPRPLLCRVDSNRFETRLRELGSPVADGAILDEIVRSPDLPLWAWIESREQDRHKRELWFWECVDRDIPYVHILHDTKNQTLKWDCVSIQSREGEAHVRDEPGDLLGGVLLAHCQKLVKRQPGKWEFFGSAFAGTVKGLDPRISHAMADEFFYELYTPMLAHRPWQRPVRKKTQAVA